MLSSNRRILDPAACIQIMSAELRPLLACRQIKPTVSTLPEASSPTVCYKRGPLLTARWSQPTASHAPLAEKHAIPWGGNSTVDYSSGQYPNKKSIPAVNTGLKKPRSRQFSLNLTLKTPSDQNKDKIRKYLQTIGLSIYINVSPCPSRVCIPLIKRVYFLNLYCRTKF